MKYVVVIPDGCADEPVAELGNRTPLQAAKLPNMDRVARAGVVGLSNNVPASLTPASDVATLSLFGYDPLVVYTGRAPPETAAQGAPPGGPGRATRLPKRPPWGSPSGRMTGRFAATWSRSSKSRCATSLLGTSPTRMAR